VTDAARKRGFGSGYAATFLLVFAGAGLRLSYAYPVHKYIPDADALLAGIRSFRILDGHFPVFFQEARLGALESYLHAAAFSFLGVGREAVTLAPLLSGIGLLVVYALVLRASLPPSLAALAMVFFAFPSPSFLYWTYLPNGYPETLLLCGTTLWLADRIRRGRDGVWTFVAFGLAAGLGWWSSFQTVSCTLPALAWAFVFRPARKPPRRASFALAGFLIGALPWVAYNVRHPLESFRSNFAAKSAGASGQIAANTAYLIGRDLPELAAGMGTPGPDLPPSRVRLLLAPVVVTICFVALSFAAGVLARDAAGVFRRSIEPPISMLFLLVFFTIAGLKVFSAAGSGRGQTLRYVLPMFFVVPVALASLATAIAARSRILAALVVSTVLLYDLASYSFPWTPLRREWRSNIEIDNRVLDRLKRENVDTLFGSYWSVYPFIFLTHETVTGVTVEPGSDFYHYAATLPAQASRRWALLSPGDEAVRWAAMAGLHGKPETIGPWHLLIPDPQPTEPATDVRDRLRIAANSPSIP
jgi:hypothetical protein